MVHKYNKLLLTERRLLNILSDIDIFQYYVPDLQLGCSITSPFREDNNPSFGIFIPNNPHEGFLESGKTVLFKDLASGICGDVFSFVSILYNIDRKDTPIRIFEDILENKNYKKNPRKFEIKKSTNKKYKDIYIDKIDWTPEALSYFSSFGITKETLDKYNVHNLDGFLLDNKHYINKKKLMFAYQVLKEFQIYSPFERRENKFYNNLSFNVFFGYLELPPTGDKLIIDKSYKDVMFCDSVLNIPAVSGKGEGIMIPDKAMEELKSRFKTIYIMLDADIAGLKSTIKYIEKYPFLIPIFLPMDKDKTDCAKRLGVDKAKAHILSMINRGYKFKFNIYKRKKK